jgi:hypothetical protein
MGAAPERKNRKDIGPIDRINLRENSSSAPFRGPGPLKPQQWAILMYKHVDHHLRQFGG